MTDWNPDNDTQSGDKLPDQLTADLIKGSKYTMKELRPRSGQRVSVRMLFVFDPARRAVILAAGNKAGNWSGWYEETIPIAEERYERHLKEMQEGRK